MGKIGILADLHLDNHREFATVTVHKPTGLPINSRLNDQLNVLVNCVLRMKKLGVTSLIVDGDICHNRVAVPIDVEQFVIWFFEWVVEQGITVYLVTGNHDQYDAEGKIHSLFKLRKLCTVIADTETHEIEGANCEFLPYMELASDVLHCVARAGSNDPVDLFVAHIGVEGAAVGPTEYRIKTPVTLKDIDSSRFGWVVLGHYHKPQSLSRNVLYVGSPYQINRAEAGDEKRFLVYAPDTRKMSSYKTGARKFATLTDVEYISGEFPSVDGYVDVIDTGVADRHALVSAMMGQAVKIIQPRKAKVSGARIEMSEHMTDQQILTAYTQHMEVKPSWTKVGQNILNVVQRQSSPYTTLTVKRVIAENFLAFSKIDIVLNRPGVVTSIIGINHRPGYTSNGVGKSSFLPECIYWCLFEETARKLPVDKIINNKVKRNCRVKVVMRLDKDLLEVTRFRKHRKLGGNGLKLVLNSKNITAGTPTETKAKLAELIGIDYKTFSSVIAFSPDNLRFVGKGESDQKQVLDSILQTRRFSAALVVSKSMLDDLKQSRLIASTRISEANALLAEYAITQSGYVTRSASFEERERERVAGLRNELRAKQSQLQILEDERGTSTDEIATKSESIVPELDSLEAAEQALEDAIQARADINSTISSYESSISELHDAITERLESAGKPCGTCGQLIQNAGKVVANLTNERKKYTRELTIENGKLNAANSTVVKCRDGLRALKEKHESQNALKAEIRLLAQAEIQRSRTILGIEAQIAKLEKAIETVPVNDFGELLIALEETIKQTEQRLEENEIDLVKKNKQIEAVEFWVKGFGIAGIRSFLLDQILPDLTQYANEFSESLTGGGTLIEFSSYNEETMKDKFKIAAYNQDGSDIYEGNSSGEKRRIDICVMFALYRIAHSRYQVNLLLLDEVLDTLDPGGIEVVPTVLQKLAEELNISIYITTHTDLNNMIHDSIVLEKRDGMTTESKQ